MMLPRRAVLATGLAALAMPAQAAAADIALVMNSADASVSVVDMASRTELRRVPVLREPHHWTLSRDTTRLLVGDSGGNAMFAFDPRTGAAIDHHVLSDPYQLWSGPDGRYLVVNAIRLDHIDVYDPTGRTLVHRFPERSMPSHLAFSPDGRMVFSTLQGTGQVVAIDLSRMSVGWREKVGPAPAGVLWHDGKLLVAVMGSNFVAVLDPATGRTLRRIVTGRGAHLVVASPDRKLLYIGNRVGGTITVLDAASLAPVRTYTLGGGPDCIAFAPDGKLWITRRFASSVAVMDPATGHADLIAVGRSPHGIFLSTILPAALRDPVAALGTASA